jgi:hypothetical protein
MDSSCELLSTLDPAWGSVHCCEMPCRTLVGGQVQHEGCFKFAQEAAHPTARRMEVANALPARGLHQVRYRRHTTLYLARRGRRCQEDGCLKSARGDTGHCIAHGGGRRCQHAGCVKSALGDTQHCVPHGGGKRCQHVGCPKAAASVDTQHCVPHGGGRRCQHAGCPKAAQSGGTQHCQAHRGGRRCQHAGCVKAVA